MGTWDVVLNSYAPDFLSAGELPELPAYLGSLAAEALDRVAGPGSELHELWAEAGPVTEAAWLSTITALQLELAGQTRLI